MNLTVHQTITIQTLRVEAVTNSSVLQIGSAGSIRSLSNQYNTGGYGQTAGSEAAEAATQAGTLVPFPAVSR
ncbi:hypothetical protein J31TS4_14020 [Paenibacillus sp. J31TS4]|uniref:spore germination protein GerPB n=1 Tax=Paenibacillus sp. J31TS4 TaxID=2807195 RepID=UPI001B2B9F3E|nr:spore germination protein GerPB [Paenibacillus sp. J31TS4]GIP38122.1 hypothetical protein J31TS4_14020 [Paenibacillus sp. J31TS4]